MPRKPTARPRAAIKTKSFSAAAAPAPPARPSALLDTRIIYCGDYLDRLQKLPDACIDLIYLDPPFNSSRNYEVFWGDRPESRPRGTGHGRFEDRHASTTADIDYMRPCCVELAHLREQRKEYAVRRKHSP